MFTRVKQFMLVAVLGAILSVVFSGTAVAAPQATFTMTKSSDPCVAPCTVTVTDTTPEAADHGWSFNYKSVYPADNFQPEVVAGSPYCLDTKCIQATWTYNTVGDYTIAEKVSNASGTLPESVKVISPTDGPAPIILNGPTTISLPTVLEILSPKSHLTGPSCTQPELSGSEREACGAYLVKRSGRDASGYYHYQLRFVMANPGSVKLTVTLWNTRGGSADQATFDLTVVASTLTFGDVRQCYSPFLKRANGGTVVRRNKPVKNVFDLWYFSMSDSRTIVEFQAKRGSRWVTVKRKAFPFLTNGGYAMSPWTRRHVRIQATPVPNRRLSYRIQNGKRVLKRGILSTKRECTVP